MVAARGLLAFALTALLIAACAAPAPGAPTNGAVGQPDPLHPATIVWLQGSGVEVNDITVAVRLTLGRGDGAVLWRDQIELDQSLPSGGIVYASGPSAGVFSYAVLDSEGATVHVVSAADPEDREVATIEEPLVSGAIDASGKWVYLATESGGNLRISRMPATGGDVESIAHLDPEFVPTGAISPEHLLRWTPDGRHLLIQACDETGSCWWQVLDEANGELTELRPEGSGTAIGVTNDTLLANVAQCVEGPCPFVLVDLATGRSRPFDPGAHQARTAITEGGETLILYDNLGVPGAIAAPARISAFDPASGVHRVVYESADPGGGFSLAREGQGGWAPPGWFVVAPGGMNVGEGGSGPVLIRIADGLEVRLASLS